MYLEWFQKFYGEVEELEMGTFICTSPLYYEFQSAVQEKL